MSDNFSKLDWYDIALHVLIALIASWFMLWTGLDAWAVILSNGVVWISRELWQHRPHYYQILTHPQSLAEWFFPIAAVVVLCVVLA